ncbi:hypothetical protein GCM10023185_38300 [Hymenobacter saemangeumensis]|uniref:SH3b domain-containing protein n=1 Tax=Hymenobacter saemangeumensis TaxID=1084522 RepID=A0ABP8IR29_9BACT
MFKLSSNTNYSGQVLYPVGQAVRVRKLKGGIPDMSTSGILRSASSPAPLGTATGRQLVPASGKGHGWMEVTDSKGAAGWVRFDLLTKNEPTAKLLATGGEKAAERLVKDYISRDVRIAKVLAEAAAKIVILRKLGVSEAKLAPIQARHQRLTSRLQARQQRLRSGKYLKVTQQTDAVKAQFTPTGAKKWFGISGIGIAPAAIWWLVAGGIALVSGVTWILAQKHYVGDAKESEQDLTECPTVAEQIAIVEKTDPAKAQKMREELNAMKAKNTAQGKAEGKVEAEKEAGSGPLAETGALVKWATVGFLAFKLLA